MAYRKFSDLLKEERAAAALHSTPRTLGALDALGGGQADTHARACAKQQQRYLFDIYSISDKQAHISPCIHGQLDCDVCAPAPPKAAKAPKAASTLQSWLAGCRSLPAAPPATDISPERWRRIVDAAASFVDRWAEDAIAAGWSTLDAFGCDPDRPGARFDCMGIVLLLDGCRIVGIDQNGADLATSTGARQRFRRRLLPRGTVSLWQLAVPHGAA